MDFFGLRYCLIMDPFVQPQRAVTWAIQLSSRNKKYAVSRDSHILPLSFSVTPVLSTYLHSGIADQDDYWDLA